MDIDFCVSGDSYDPELCRKCQGDIKLGSKMMRIHNEDSVYHFHVSCIRKLLAKESKITPKEKAEIDKKRKDIQLCTGIYKELKRALKRIGVEIEDPDKHHFNRGGEILEHHNTHVYVRNGDLILRDHWLDKSESKLSLADPQCIEKAAGMVKALSDGHDALFKGVRDKVSKTVKEVLNANRNA